MEVLLIAAAPVLAMFASFALFNAICRMRNEEHVMRRSRSAGMARDQMYNDEYCQWLQQVDEAGGLIPIDSPVAVDRGERCYAFNKFVSLYESSSPERRVVDSGAFSAMGTTIMDGYNHVRLLDRGSLCITDRRIRFDGMRAGMVIPLGDVSSVEAETSGLMVESRSTDGVMLFNGVNGRQLRDTINMLMEQDED